MCSWLDGLKKSYGSNGIQRVNQGSPFAPACGKVDLKARRELRAGKTSGALDVVWFDQAVVRAALAGRVLIIEGLEKARWRLRDDRNLENELKDERYACIRRRS